MVSQLRMWRGVAGRTALTLFILGAGACKPNLEGRPSLIDSPRVIGLRSEAAEAKPGNSVTYDMLLASPIDQPPSPSFDWAFCNARKPLAQSGPISLTCLQPSGPDLQDLGNSPSVMAQLPSDVCSVFGPVPPTPKAGEPTVRPTDPDSTGGYYQPVRLLTHYSSNQSEYEIGVTRIDCRTLPNVLPEILAEYTKSYVPNVNPQIETVTMAEDGSQLAIDLSAQATPQNVRAGDTVQFTVTWPSCPSEPNGSSCAGSEAYVYYDNVSQTIVNRRESIQVSWYTTDGSFEHDRTGQSEQDADICNTANHWTAPDNAGPVRFWLVIRDDRRGVSWQTFDVQVTQ